MMQAGTLYECCYHLSCPMHRAIAVSLYESGSEDGSNVWLHLLKLLLCQIEVPFKVKLLAQAEIDLNQSMDLCGCLCF